MTNWDIDLSRLLHFLLEGFVVLLAFLNFTIIKYPEIAIGFLLIYVIGGLLYWLYIKKKREDITLGSLVIFSPIIILIGMFVLQLSLVFTLVFTAYIVWRVLGHFHEVDYENEIVLFIVSLLIGLFEFIRFETQSESKYIFILLVVQLLLTIFIKLNRVYIEMKRQGNPASTKFAKWGFGLTGSLFGLGIVAALFFPLIQATLFFLFETLISVLAYITIYPLSWLLAYFNPEISGQILDSMQNNTDEVFKPFGDPSKEAKGLPIDPNVFYIIGGIIVAVLIAIFFFKKLDLKPYFSPALATNTKIMTDGNLESGFGQRKKYAVPSNEIRKRFYSFENLMIKYELGRKPYEPVLDWLKRIEFTDVNLSDVKSLYEKVRYGEFNLNEHEEKHYYKLMEDLTAIAKEKYKENKKNRKAEKKAEKKSKQGNSIGKQIKENKLKHKDSYGGQL